MEDIPGCVTAPRKFKANGIACGIKKRKKDLALIYSEIPAETAGVFTKNRFRAAPVLLSSSCLGSGKKRAFIINSGNANAATGRRGFEDVVKVSSALALQLGVAPRQVLASSTGVIGKYLPVEKILSGIKPLVGGLSHAGGLSAAEAIMTTDTFIKQKAVMFSAGGADVRMGAIAKGSGMIAPDMATMLCFITTDASIEKDALYRALRNSVKVSFNRITVDGDCSTNDTVLIMANGAAENIKIRAGGADFKKFKSALDFLCLGLARMIVMDGEGASKLFEVSAEGAMTLSDAKKICFAVANSLLVKTAVSGENPNWGRIVSAAGASGAYLEPGKFSVSIGDCVFFKNGSPAAFRPESALREMKKREISIKIRLGTGDKRWSVLSSDLTEDYVRINKEYS